MTQTKKEEIHNLNERQKALMMDLRIKKIEIENLRKDLQNEFKFLKN